MVCLIYIIIVKPQGRVARGSVQEGIWGIWELGENVGERGSLIGRGGSGRDQAYGGPCFRQGPWSRNLGCTM